MTEQAKEKRFLDALESLFTGAKVEGDSGFVNLMRIKRQYFQSIQPMLMEKIDQRAEPETSFREELFDKLWTFFRRYFCESGSIYFRHLPAFAKTYERVYADDKDVALSWKTRMLYYVKSDVLVHSMPVELRNRNNPEYRRQFYFDVSEIEHKRNNEKREFVFAFDKVDNATGFLHLKVSYSRGKKTKADDIIKQARKGRLRLSEDELEKACRIFRRQTEVDFFINKDARGFLREQFDLWLYQYMFQEETIFEQPRLVQLQAIQKTAYDIIDFIAQFEDELRRAWEKPKFVRGVHYVVTLDKLPDKTLKKIAKHKGAESQVNEWRELGMVDEEFSMKMIFKGQKSFEDKNGMGENYNFLPLDTKYFKDLELEILDALGNLDEALDGELVHSENWQALNSLQRRYKGKVKCIYIDPPFNLDSSDQFDYRTNYKDSCWATLLENRLALAKTLLSETGSIFVRCDYNGNWVVRCLMDNCFGSSSLRNELIINRISKKGFANRESFRPIKYPESNDFLFFYAKSKSSVFHFVKIKVTGNQKEKWHSMDVMDVNPQPRPRIILGKEMIAPKGRKWLYSQEKIDEMEKQGLIRLNKNRVPQYKVKNQDFELLDSNWTDIPGYTSTAGFQTENSEKLLDRVIQTASNKADIVMDFFLGSGTTTAVANKLGRKWLGVEMGAHFHTVILPRMKKVIGGHQSGISKQTDYKGGGAFKYYSLEQYEETLKNARYKDGEQLEIDSLKSPFEQYVFFNDDKLAHAVQPLKNKKLKINLHDLYPDVDIAESLSNALGKSIRHRTAESVTFADGTMEKINPAKMTEKEKQHFIATLKPYLWWGGGH